jgi:hypothetical protein
VVAVTGLMVTDTLYFFISLCLFELAFGAVGQFFQAARTSLLLKEHHYT